MTLLDRIEYLCKLRGITKRTMELDIGLSSGASSKWRKGAPMSATLDKVAKYFGVTTDYLLGKSDYKTDKELIVNTYNKTAEKKLEAGVLIPILGRVVAGIPLDAIQDILGYEEIPADLANRGEFFGLQVRGDSMSPRMLEGDVVIVRAQNTANTGDIVIAQFEDDSSNVKSCVKKFIRTDSGVVLQSYNPLYEPIVFSDKEANEHDFQIMGKVVELRGKFN